MLRDVKTMERFYDVMRILTRRELDANGNVLDNYFDDPNIHEGEQDRILSIKCEK
jgi:hypothetical protein